MKEYPHVAAAPSTCVYDITCDDEPERPNDSSSISVVVYPIIAWRIVNTSDGDTLAEPIFTTSCQPDVSLDHTWFHSLSDGRLSRGGILFANFEAAVNEVLREGQRDWDQRHPST